MNKMELRVYFSQTDLERAKPVGRWNSCICENKIFYLFLVKNKLKEIIFILYKKLWLIVSWYIKSG